MNSSETVCCMRVHLGPWCVCVFTSGGARGRFGLQSRIRLDHDRTRSATREGSGLPSVVRLRLRLPRRDPDREAGAISFFTYNSTSTCRPQCTEREGTRVHLREILISLLRSRSTPRPSTVAMRMTRRSDGREIYKYDTKSGAGSSHSIGVDQRSCVMGSEPCEARRQYIDEPARVIDVYPMR